MESLLALEMMVLASFVLHLALPTQQFHSSLTQLAFVALKPSLGFKHQGNLFLCSHKGETTNAIINVHTGFKGLIGKCKELGCNGQGCSRGFSVPTGCSGCLLSLEGTVHSDFEAWTSLKNQLGSCGGRKG